MDLGKTFGKFIGRFVVGLILWYVGHWPGGRGSKVGVEANVGIERGHLC